jgi:HlyD family secretion protein
VKKAIKRIVNVLVLLAVAGGVAYVFRPQPLVVDTATVTQGPMQVAIDEDGQTRAHDRFTLAAPVAGILSRITLREGDRVSRDAVIATVRPLPLDTRAETGIRAEIAAAEAAEREAAQLISRAETAHQQAKRDLARAEMLFKSQDISRQSFEEAQSKEAMLAKDLEAARFRAASAAAETARARAGLISEETEKSEQSRITSLRAPFAARILQILEKNERVVSAGTPIVMLSNPGRLEIVADLLSTDAVNVKLGAAVSVENWGGPKALRARVRTVEPYGFTKVSALGVEEQRVNVVSDFLDGSENLGDGYRVDVRIVIWESPRVIKVPASALFRVSSDWNVFVMESTGAKFIAKQRALMIGHRNAIDAEVLSGLKPGEEVVVHPPSELKDRAQLKRRTR